uniref:Uncharacterized protein n=1 Tax=Panagrolaimus sp. ES5 TaxID=591445 RepID=A0AC34GHK2_9BILA
MSIIFRQLEDDANDVMNKLERKSKSFSLVSWELDGILTVICQLVKQAYDVALSGFLDQTDEKSTVLSLFLSSEYFETVVNDIKII